MLPPFFHQTPFFRFLLPFVAGIVVGFRFTVPAAYSIVVCACFMLAAMFIVWNRKRINQRRWGWIYGILLHTFLVAAGMCVVSLQKPHLPTQTEHAVWMVVVDEPPTEKANSMQAAVRVKSRLTNEQTVPCDERVLAYFRKDSLSRHIQQGDLLIVDATLQLVRNAGNPYEFDYQSYLARKHIGRNTFVESGHWRKLHSYSQGGLHDLANKMRVHLLDILVHAGLTGNEFAVTSALTLGYRADLDETLRDAYAASGAMHVLAVSGLHAGIVYMVLAVLLNNLFPFMRRMKVFRAIILLSALWMYALITGLSPSVLRAATMFSFIAAGEAFNRRAYTYNSIAASAFLLLFVNPGNLFEVGFQLSYMAVIAIVFLHPYLYGLLSFKHIILNKIWSLTCVSLAAQAGTVPLSLFYFEQFPTYFILSNFVVIPAATIVIYGAALLFIVSPVPILLHVFGGLLDKFLYMVNSSIFFIEKMPGSLVSGIRFAGWEIFFAYSLLIALSIWLLSKRKTALYATFILILLWITGATFRTVHDLQQQKLIVYNTQGNSLFQFVEGRNHAVWYASYNTTFNAGNFIKEQCTAMQLNEGHYNLLDSLHQKEKYLHGLFAIGNFVQFAGKRIVIFTRNMPPQHAVGHSIRTDVAILTQNINVRIPQIIESYQPEIIVMDASNAQARINRWERECTEIGVKYHRIDRDGAFIIE